MTGAYGFDPAFRHGALVYAEFELDSGAMDKLSHYEIVYSWGKRSEGIGEDSDPSEVFKLVQRIITPLKDRSNLPISVDWDPRSVYWRSRKLQVVQLSLMIGYFTRACQTLGFPVIYIKPQEVRKSLGLFKADKESLQLWFSEQCDLSDYENQFTTKNSDFLDAVILAYLVARSIHRKGSYSCRLLTSPD